MTFRLSDAAAILLGALVVLAGAAPVSAQEPPAKAAPSSGAATQSFDAGKLADQAIAGTRDRLKLTDDQIRQIKPPLMETMTKLRQSFAGYWSADGAQFQTLAREVQSIRESFRSRLRAILSTEQMKEYMTISKEVDKALRDTTCAARLAAVKPRLALSPDQEPKVGSILCEDWESKRELALELTASTGDPASTVSPEALYQKIEDATEVQLKQVLSPEQMKAYQAYLTEARAKAPKPSP